MRTTPSRGGEGPALSVCVATRPRSNRDQEIPRPRKVPESKYRVLATAGIKPGRPGAFAFKEGEGCQG